MQTLPHSFQDGSTQRDVVFWELNSYFPNITCRHSHLASGIITAHSFGKHSASTYYTLGTVAAEECLTVPAHKIIREKQTHIQ